MDFGQFEGKTQKELENLPEYTAWLKGGPEACPPEGEKFGDFSLRCISGLDIIFRDMMKKEITRAAMVTHGGVITNLLAGLRPAEWTSGRITCAARARASRYFFPHSCGRRDRRSR